MDENKGISNFKNSKILFATSFDDTNVLNRKCLINAVMNNFQAENYEAKYDVLLDYPTPFNELELLVKELCKRISKHYDCKIWVKWDDVVFACKTTDEGMEVISVMFNIGFDKPKKQLYES